MGGAVNGMAGSLPTQQSIGNPYTPTGTGVNPNVPYGLQSSPMQGFGGMMSPYGGSYGSPYAMQSPYQQQSYGPPPWAQQQQNWGPPPWAQQSQQPQQQQNFSTTGPNTPGQTPPPPFQGPYGGPQQQYQGWGGGNDNWHHGWGGWGQSQPSQAPQAGLGAVSS